MRSVASRYPVDRYLVESSKKFEMVNIIDNDTWNTEPALKPEDEIMLRKLHEMLQSTADDLKLLSGELSKFHEQGVQVKTTPTPLDEEFNEKVHIEEIVNAKFHGYKIVNKPSPFMAEDSKHTINSQETKSINVPVKTLPVNKKPINRSLGIARTKIIQIDGNENSKKTEKLNNGKVVNAPAVAYNEYSFKYIEPKNIKKTGKKLQVQQMPSINIRSEFKEQKVLQLDITPEVKECEKPDMVTKNVAVIAIQHETPKPSLQMTTKPRSTETIEVNELQQSNKSNATRKVYKMSTCESSGSNNNISSDTQMKLNTHKRILTTIKSSPKSAAGADRKKVKKEPEKRTRLNVEEWRKKLNAVYGPVKKNKTSKAKTKMSPKKVIAQSTASNKPNNLNNREYIPYSKLTVGGVRASDIEKELSEIQNKNDIPLSPILNKILSSRENSFAEQSPRNRNPKQNMDFFTTSDENLLREVIDIERTVSETLSKNLKSTKDPKGRNIKPNSNDSDEVKDDSYIDDFEDEDSDHSEQSGKDKTRSIYSEDEDKCNDQDKDDTLVSDDAENDNYHKEEEPGPSVSNTQVHNITYIKQSNLSFKNTVDIFEYVHSVDTQESATQSNTIDKIFPKETQTSPVTEKAIQPIHNDLWPTIDPKGEVDKMFKLEKEFIKRLIVEEYGDILEKNLDKPSTSKVFETKRNIAASQKNTQTSPAHVKNVMTSPTRTKTRTTSPFPKLSVDHHTSPLIFVTNEEDVRLQGENENEEDPGISVNLSSPRFSLRLPQSSREVLSNLSDSARKTDNKQTAYTNAKHVKKRNITTTSTSSFEADSSELSSLGEVRIRRRLRKAIVISDSESVTSASSKYSSDLQTGILPLKSEGEMSLGRNNKSNKISKSEGEASFGLM